MRDTYLDFQETRERDYGKVYCTRNWEEESSRLWMEVLQAIAALEGAISDAEDAADHADDMQRLADAYAERAEQGRREANAAKDREGSAAREAAADPGRQELGPFPGDDRGPDDAIVDPYDDPHEWAEKYAAEMEALRREMDEAQAGTELLSHMFGYGGLIKGFTGHGITSAIFHDGHGVNEKALLDAVTNPVEVVVQEGGKKLYKGKNAAVVLSDAGRVVTCWARNKSGYRVP